ncbi:hypothetical protein MJM45_32630, partial [Salmonella enterica subsp. enterica serovar Kentucky]|nr:hypothetical protein [Salmonella enterica subsp. enterica serovar Kentucky]
TQLSHAGCRVIAEGRYNTPALAANAIEHGAWAVTVGSAITRICCVRMAFRFFETLINCCWLTCRLIAIISWLPNCLFS